VTFDVTAGLLSGSPASGTNGSYPLIFTASNGITPDATQSFTLTVNPAPPTAPTITSSSSTSFAVGSAGSFTVTASGFPLPALSLGGGMPSGVSFDAGTGLLSGTPASGSYGRYPLTVTASNGVAPDAVADFTLTIGAVPLPRTGQEGCWNAAGAPISCGGTGQDGDLRKGAPLPSPRFIDNGDQTVTDQLTGLMWTKSTNPASIGARLVEIAQTWQQALDYIKEINGQNYLGHHDWRLPNIVELHSLVSAQQGNSTAWLASFGFTDFWNVYWSSTTYPRFPTSALSIFLMAGTTDAPHKGPTRYGATWPVRGVSPVLPRTGQTDCWDETGAPLSCVGTGQDGELQRGVAWPAPRFVDQGDGTITDNLTGLIWSKDANPGVVLKGWQAGLDYIKALNGQRYLGYQDWRLPNVVELRSLVNYQYANQAAWLNGSGFENVRSEVYHTSTSMPGDPRFNYRVIMEGGLAIGAEKTTDIIWPVRGGQ
jgi:hypothetical protein